MRKIAVKLLNVLIACTTLQVYAQTARLQGPVQKIEPEQFGYNLNTYITGPKWSNPEFRHTVTRLRPGNVRYPGGTIANYWDWRTGNIINTITQGFPKYRNDTFSYTPYDIVKAVPDGTEITYCINMARPTPETGISVDESFEVLASQETLDKKIVDILAGIQAFYDAGYPLKKVELGNEFYQGAAGGVNGQGGVYSGDVDLYIDHANQIAEAIHIRYPKIKLSVIGDSDSKINDGLPEPWTDSVYTAIEESRLNHIDAITFHWYTGPGTPQLFDAQDAKRSLNQTFKQQNTRRISDYADNRLGLELWITEYNTFSQPGESKNPNNPGGGGSIQGTWINGMFGANLSLLYTMLGPEVSALNIHVISKNNIQWAMIEKSTTLTGNGVALGLVGRAMRGMNKAQAIEFSGIGNPTFGADDSPSLYGVKFWNSERSAVIIMNNTEEARNSVAISELLSGDGTKRLTQYYDETPFLPDIDSPEEYKVTEDSGLMFDFKDELGDTADFPPFSITVIEQENENLIVNSSFESTSEGWSNLENSAVGRKNAYTGSRSLLLNNATNKCQSVSQIVAVDDKSTYRLSTFMRTRLEQGFGSFTLKFFDIYGRELKKGISSKKIQGTNTYQEVSEKFKVPNKACGMKVVLSANGIGRVWFDDVVLREVEKKNKKWKAPDRAWNRDFVKVFPNPATETKITVILGDEKSVPDLVSIVDLWGQKVLEATPNSDGELDISQLPRGIYTLNVHTGDKTWQEKLIVD